MNYRHIYHAGNFADVFKHCVLTMLLQHLLQKDKPIFYLDTHAGIGKYDLTADNAQKTKEYENGIGRLYSMPINSECPQVVQDYLQIVKEINPDANTSNHLKFYPGSPLLVKSLLREQDKIVLIEMHGEDILELKKQFRQDRQVAIHHMDGFQSLKAFLPPKIGRGLILIDPAYEDKNEFAKIINGVTIALARYPLGIYALWYPIKDRLTIDNFYRDLKMLSAKEVLITELAIDSNSSVVAEGGLISSGMVIINPPWQFVNKLKPVLEYLSSVLAVDEKLGKYRIGC